MTQLEEWLKKASALPPEQSAKLTKWAKTELVRAKSLKNNQHPAQLAKSIDPAYTITPAIELISKAVEKALHTRRARLLITMPPQEGKSELIGTWSIIRALQHNPDRRIILASYSTGLAEQATVKTRNIMQAHGAGAIDPLTKIEALDKIGLQLADDKQSATHWRIQGRKGGLIGVGFGGTITGRPADLLIIDDPLKGMQAADSATERRRVIESFQGDLSTRLAPGAPIILIQTRWNENDLAGWILKQEEEEGTKRRWLHINIPAQSEEGIPDALNRPPGEYMISARGRTPEDFEETKRAVGIRVWSALYQGVPTPATGGLFAQEWFNQFRLEEQPKTLAKIVSIDPAETGKNDEAGIVAMAHTETGQIVLTHDYSGLYTSAQWARRAIILALKTRAHEVAYEAYSTEQTYLKVLKDAYTDIVIQARLLQKHKGSITNAGNELRTRPRAPLNPFESLAEISTIKIDTHQLEPPFRIHPIRGKGDKTARASGLRQAAQTGRFALVGTFPMFESQARTWQQGQSSPDRLDAVVNGYNRLTDLNRGAMTVPIKSRQIAQKLATRIE